VLYLNVILHIESSVISKASLAERVLASLDYHAILHLVQTNITEIVVPESHFVPSVLLFSFLLIHDLLL